MTALTIDDRGHDGIDIRTTSAPVVALVPPVPPSLDATPVRDAAGGGAYDELRVLADSFEDAQRTRIQIENRLRSGTVPSAPVEEALASLLHAEKKLGLAMRRSFRTTAPHIYQWVKDTAGIGEHLMARLLGCIGDPLIAQPYHWEGDGAERVLIADEPFVRSVSQLWSYCGHGDPTRKRRKGMTVDEAFALGSPKAKMIVHLLAESAMKCTGGATTWPGPDYEAPPGADSPSGSSDAAGSYQDSTPGGSFSDDAPSFVAMPRHAPVRRRSPYRDVYDHARRRYADRDWTPAHQHNAALRYVGKQILRDLWIAAHQEM